MALTASEEALVRQLLDQQAAILSLAGNEATITSKLGATKVTLADLVAASSLADADLLLTRQGTTDKSVRADILAAYMGAELGALFAPIANPTFTGDPKAPTAAQFDNDTSLATTAFVQRALGNFKGEATYNVDTQLTVDAFGRLIIFAGSAVANRTFTLPKATDGAAGSKIQFWNNSAYNLTVVPFAGDFLDTGTTIPASIVLGPGSTLVCETFSSVGWRLIGGTARLKNSHEFSSSLAASGYQKLPSGLIIQWGNFGPISDGATLVITFPVSFTASCLFATAIRAEAGGGDADSFSINARSAANMTVQFQDSGTSFSTSNLWFAIGY